MCGGPYDPDPDNVVTPNCRVCDYNPCMCGQRKYMSDRAYREEVRKYNEEINSDPLGPSAVPEDWGS